MAGDIQRTRQNTIGGMMVLRGADPQIQQAIEQLQDNIRRLYALTQEKDDVAAGQRSQSSTILAVANRRLSEFDTKLGEHDAKIGEHSRLIQNCRELLAGLLSLPFFMRFYKHDDPLQFRSAASNSLSFAATGTACRGLMVASGPIYMDRQWSYEVVSEVASPILPSTLDGTKEHLFYLQIRVKQSDATLQDVTVQRIERTAGAQWPTLMGNWLRSSAVLYDYLNVPLATLTCAATYFWTLTNLQGGQAISLANPRNNRPVFVQITGGGPGTSHTGSVYDDGPDQAATLTGVTIKLPQIHATATMPTGSWMLAIRIGSTYWGMPTLWQ